MLHDVRESRGDGVDGDSRDEGLTGRRVPFHAFGRFSRQCRCGGGVGSEQLVRRFMFSVSVLLGGVSVVRVFVFVALLLAFGVCILEVQIYAMKGGASFVGRGLKGGALDDLVGSTSRVACRVYWYCHRSSGGQQRCPLISST